jgi:arylsulfatase
MSARRPDILFIMTDQQRFDTIAALGNEHIFTPNLDRLVRRGVSFSRAYATCPVCVAARYTIRTGCEPPTTRVFSNSKAKPVPNQPERMEERCGPYLARTMSALGYRTFGVGKFHAAPWNEDLGFETIWRSEENPVTRESDDYATWLARDHPEFDFLEQPMGERTEMYYLPQRSSLPFALGSEYWAAEHAVAEIAQRKSDRPYFGFVSFVGPHPPLAPPIPFNRAYDPDKLPEPHLGKLEQDHLDEEIPYMQYAIWAEGVSAAMARIIKARYYGEISYVDFCLGKILDAVETGGNAHNTLICFFSDHGDLLGDHHGWQKQNFFEASCRIPFLLSWPEELSGGVVRLEFVSLADLFGIATAAAGKTQVRQGRDIVGVLRGRSEPRSFLAGMAERPGSEIFKIMVVKGKWKYIFMANGGREQLFNLEEDPGETINLCGQNPQIEAELYRHAVEACRHPGAEEALEGEELRSFDFRERPRHRIYQFDRSRGVNGFPNHPAELLGNLGMRRQ